LAEEGLAQYQGASLGIYDPIDFRINNETVYRQRGGSNWLYKDEYWYFNANLGARTGQLRASKLGARGGGWEYGRNNSWVGMRGGGVLRLMS